MKKAIVLVGMLGLSMAGLRADLKKAGQWISEHHQAIETGVNDAIQVGSVIADDSFINLQGLIQDGIQTVGDITAKKKNVPQLIEDGLKIIGDLTEKSGSTESSNSEELFADVAFVNVQGLIKDGIQTVGDITAKKKNVPQLIEDGLKIIGDLTEKSGSTESSNSEELFSLSDALHDAGDVAGVVSAGVEVAGLFA